MLGPEKRHGIITVLLAEVLQDMAIGPLRLRSQSGPLWRGVIKLYQGINAAGLGAALTNWKQAVSECRLIRFDELARAYRPRQRQTFAPSPAQVHAATPVAIRELVDEGVRLTQLHWCASALCPRG